MGASMCLAVVGGVVFGALAAAQSVNLRPGKYEVTMEMDMPGMSFKMPPQKARRMRRIE